MIMTDNQRRTYRQRHRRRRRPTTTTISPMSTTNSSSSSATMMNHLSTFSGFIVAVVVVLAILGIVPTSHAATSTATDFSPSLLPKVTPILSLMTYYMIPSLDVIMGYEIHQQQQQQHQEEEEHNQDSNNHNPNEEESSTTDLLSSSETTATSDTTDETPHTTSESVEIDDDDDDDVEMWNPVHTITSMVELQQLIRKVHHPSLSSTTSSSSNTIHHRYYHHSQHRSQQTFLLPSSILYVILAYKDDCDDSMQQVWRFEYAVHEFWKQQHQQGSAKQQQQQQQQPQPVFIQLAVNDDTFQIVEEYGIQTVPSMFFVKGVIPGDKKDDVDDGANNNDNGRDDDADNSSEMVPFYAIPYRGITTDVSELVNGINHYISRLRYSNIVQRNNTINSRLYQDSLTIHVNSYHELQHNVLTFGGRKEDDDSKNDNDNSIPRNNNNVQTQFNQFFFQPSPPIPLDPYFSDSEDEWIRYLMDDGNSKNDDDNSIPTDTTIYHVICQCRSRSDDIVDDETLLSTNRSPQELNDLRNELITAAVSLSDFSSSLNLTVYSEFDLVTQTLSARRDVLFCVVDDDCRYDVIGRGDDRWQDEYLAAMNGSITAFTATKRDMEWTLHKKEVLVPSTNQNFTDWILPMLRPDVLWLDRRMTAPIVFQQQYDVHAVLFVDFHDRSTAKTMRDAIRVFRTECYHQRQQYGDNSMVCLVVPSTDTRVLTTFGIDIWTPLDEYATKILSVAKCKGNSDLDECMHNDGGDGSNNYNETLSPPVPVLPTLLLTNRRQDGSGIERYYLEDGPITSTNVKQFFHDFRSGHIKPHIKSYPRKNNTVKGTTATKKNDHGIHLLTGHTLQQFLNDYKQHHVLLQLYAPTCGHCKRFNIIWNRLGDLLQYLGWTDRYHIILARMDVTSNDHFFVPGMDSSWLPDMFYFGKDCIQNPIRYEETKTGKQVPLGAFNDALDVIDWWLDQADDTIDSKELLESLSKNE